MTTPQNIETLIDRVALGDRKAFAALYDAVSGKLFGVALRILNNRPEAEDALQEIFVKIWRSADKYQANGLSPMTWLITIARNHAIDVLRRRKRAGDDLEHADQVPDPVPGPEAQAIASDTRSRIAACLSALPADHADAVRRVYLDGETYQTMATRHDVPLNTMRTWLRRSLLKLRECLAS